MSKKIYKIEDYLGFKKEVLNLATINYHVINEQIDKVNSIKEKYNLSEDVAKLRLYSSMIEVKDKKELFDDNEKCKEIIEKANNILPNNVYIYLGSTPIVFELCALNSTLPLEIHEKNLIKSQTKDIDHTILDSNLLNLYESLKNPIMILKGSHDKSFVALIDDKDAIGRYILVPLEYYEYKDHEIVMVGINTIYGRNNLKGYITNHGKDVIAYNENRMKLLVSELENIEVKKISDLQVELSKQYGISPILSLTYDDTITQNLLSVKMNGKPLKIDY